MVAGKVVNRFGHFPILTFSIIFMFLSMIVIAFSPSLLYLLVTAVLFGSGLTFATPILMSLAVTLSSKDVIERAMSTLTVYFDLGIGLGSIGVGYVVSLTNITAGFLAGSGILLFNLFFTRYQSSKIRYKTKNTN